MPSAPPDRSSLTGLLESQSLLKLLSVVSVAVAAGLSVSWVTVTVPVEPLNLHIAIWTFLIVWAGIMGYVLFVPVPSAVVGSGLYVIGLSIILKPPMVFFSRVDTTAADALMLTEIRSVADLFTAFLVFGVVGVGVIVLGAYLRKRGAQQRNRRIRASLRGHD